MEQEKSLTLQEIWKEVQSYEGEGSKKIDLPSGRVQFYKGAMEIPLVAFFFKNSLKLDEPCMKDFSSLLLSLQLELECVEEENNYKINCSDTKLYLGRVTSDSLKIHLERIKEMGDKTFCKIVNFFLKTE